MTPYKNLRGSSKILSYETTEDSIHIEFDSGDQRHYVYNHIRPGKLIVDTMKALAARGHGLNSYIVTTVKSNYYEKW